MKLLTAFFLISLSTSLFGQNNDTLLIIYNTNSSSLNQTSIDQINSFVKEHQAKSIFNIIGHTDDVGEESYNEVLSVKRAKKVNQLLVELGVDTAKIIRNHHGESKPRLPNSNAKNRAVNRRVELIRLDDPNVTQSQIIVIDSTLIDTLDGDVGERVLVQPNGIIIRDPARILPDIVAKEIEQGLNPFTLIENIEQMQENNIITMMTDSTPLSSLAMVCGPENIPCDIDTAIVISVPINNPYNCPLDSIKFLYAEVQQGRRLWQESNEDVYPTIIDGKQYINVTLTNPCGCINFDYKISPPCFPVDTVRVKFRKAKKANFEIILEDYNSIILPKLINKKIIEFIVPKDNIGGVYLDVNFRYRSSFHVLKRVPLKDFKFNKKKEYYYLPKRKLVKYKKKQAIYD